METNKSGENKSLYMCPDCDRDISYSALTCPHCGKPTKLDTKKNRGVAILLAALLGGFGIHKFYLGRIGWGIVYLLFFWTVIPGIVGVVEAIMMATMTESEFNKKYNH
jgi:TM2 domain-containing membrane protein YozV